MNAEAGGKPEIGGFAAVLNSRLASEARIAKAKSLLWACGGAGIAFCLSGLGAASALYGYSYVYSVKPAADAVAAALTHALERAELKTVVSGDVSLSGNTELRLAAGQFVNLESSSFVKLDPHSSVRVVGDVKLDVPQPSRQQLQLDTRSKTDELPFTNYTIFKTVPHGGGSVVTGWNYDLSDNLRPRVQYCYYTQPLEKGVAAKYTLAFNGRAQSTPPPAKLSLNIDDALSSCIWFSGN